MSEFYTNLNEGQIQEIIDDKIKIYNDEIKFAGYHNVLMDDLDFVYRYYAQSKGFEYGSFELFRYIGMWDGTEVYHFYVEQPVSEETKRMHRERKIETIRSRNKFRLKRKYEASAVEDLNRELKKRGLPTNGKKKEKMKTLAEEDLKELIGRVLGD